MRLECTVDTLNLRSGPSTQASKVGNKMALGDLIEVGRGYDEWVNGKVLTGNSAGTICYARRMHLIDHFDSEPQLLNIDRSKAAEIITSRTSEFDGITYDYETLPATWADLADRGKVACSGWARLVGNEILEAYGKYPANRIPRTYSDDQIIQLGARSKIISGRFVKDHLFQPGVLVAINAGDGEEGLRILGIDHITIVGEDGDGRFVSQSSNSGSGVNRVPLDKWLDKYLPLAGKGKLHLVDLLALT